MDKQLKSCPFCGHKASLWQEQYQINQSEFFPEFKHKSIVKCNKCRASVGFYTTDEIEVECYVYGQRIEIIDVPILCRQTHTAVANVKFFAAIVDICTIM